MTKRQLIDQIITVNRSARPGFLARFDDQDLRDYLDHLHAAQQPRPICGTYHDGEYLATGAATATALAEAPRDDDLSTGGPWAATDDDRRDDVPMQDDQTPSEQDDQAPGEEDDQAPSEQDDQAPGEEADQAPGEEADTSADDATFINDRQDSQPAAEHQEQADDQDDQDDEDLDRDQADADGSDDDAVAVAQYADSPFASTDDEDMESWLF